MSLLAELKRRNVIRMAGLYIVGAWVVVQVAETLLPIFEVPNWVLRALIILLALGFVPTLVFSWLYELTPEGLKRDHEVDRAQSITAETAKRLDVLTLGALAVVVLLMAADRFWPRHPGPASAAAVDPAATVADAASAEAEPAPGAAESATAGGAAKPAVSDQSVAVLPFVNMSNDPDQEYFSDGISEELLNRLAKIPDLQVAARTSAFQFKGKNQDIGDIGRQLRVAHVLEGSVRKAGIRLRITAQLIDSRSGYHLWSETYDRDATDVFRVQDEIAEEIARALKSKLGVESGAASRAGRADPEAFDDYLLGRSFVAKRWVENLSKAIEAFDRAIARDPGFAAAYSGRAFAQLLMPMWDSGESARFLRAARASADQALAIDPDDPQALMVRGMAAFFSYRSSEARVDLERALTLAPNSVDILNLYGDFLYNAGDLGRAERMKHEAMLRDPLALVHPLNLADIMIAQGRNDEALVFAEQAQRLGAAGFALDRLATAYAHLGRAEDAASVVEQACSLDAPKDRSCSLGRALVLVAQGQRAQAAQLFADAIERKMGTGLPEDEGNIHFSPWGFVEAGDIASATRFQQRCIDHGCWFVTAALIGTQHGTALPEEISDDPEWLAVWADPRIADVMQDFRRSLLAWRAESR